MKIEKAQWKLAREALGVILMVVSLVLAVTFLVASAGIGTTVVFGALVGLAALGRWLASGTDTETDDGTEGDRGPLGPGPLYQDPEDPQAFIPRR